MPTKWPGDEWPIPDATADMEWTAFESPDMWCQIMYAQATFLEFARCADLERFRVVPTYDEIALKAFFENPGRPPFGEHIFLTDVATDGKMVTATLSAAPNFASDLQEDQEVTFPVGKVSDWFLVRGGKGIGGFTIPLIHGGLSSAKQQAYSQQPPFVWFGHREGIEPHEELASLPQCTKCGQRNLADPDDRGPICGICSNGGHRCDCTSCGAPLIRFPDAPLLCHRCLGHSAT